jgi:hypothetical protein
MSLGLRHRGRTVGILNSLTENVYLKSHTLHLKGCLVCVAFYIVGTKA